MSVHDDQPNFVQPQNPKFWPKHLEQPRIYATLSWKNRYKNNGYGTDQANLVVLISQGPFGALSYSKIKVTATIYIF